MKKALTILFCASLMQGALVRAQVLNVPQVIQEQNNWCWAGCTDCILQYYGDTMQQCTIAEYVRQVATWHSFGTVDCCVDASQGCDYWNYNWGYAGSMQDILLHFDNISSYGLADTLSKSQIATEVVGGRPFIARWGWYSGGGHFLVGHGISSNNLYYMNPWYGEGLKISTYSWFYDDGNHNWNMTNVLTTSPQTGLSEDAKLAASINLSPNPTSGKFALQGKNKMRVEIVNALGESVYTAETEPGAEIDLSAHAKGVYIARISSGGKMCTKKVVVE